MTTRVLTAAQMREADRHAIEVVGIPSLVLMENAGREVAGALEESLAGGGMGDVEDASVLVLCGRGNNGGDGMVVARRLASRGATVRVVLLADPDDLSGDAARQWALLRKSGVPAQACDAKDWPDVRETLEDADVIVDALLGTGFHGRLEGLLAEVVEDVNASDVPVVAVDVPSGLSGDTAAIAGPAIEASLTVTFAAPKICHVFAPAHERCGDLVIADIGIPEKSLASSGSRLVLTEDEAVAALIADLADRAEDTHKGTWGHVVVVGGSIGRSGAPALSALGALTAGCGLVTVATPEACLASVAAHAPELMQVALPSTDSGEVADTALPIDALLDRATVLVVGPGLGTGDGAARLLWELLEAARVPVVLDADALNLLSRSDEIPGPSEDRPLVLTPHPGEFARLVAPLSAHDGAKKPRGQHERLPAAIELADRYAAIVVLKGFRTVVVAPGDEDVHVSVTGNPGMGTAGTGDVLSGFLGGLIAQGVAPWAAAVAAVHLHGRAGDIAEEEAGQMALRATNLLRAWPAAVASVLHAGAEDDDD